MTERKSRIKKKMERSTKKDGNMKIRKLREMR